MKLYLLNHMLYSTDLGFWGMSAFQILMMKKVPEKAGLFTLFRIVIEIAVLTALYVIMTLQ